ncbi:MAG TPA: ATP-dependent helicase [Candidatus Saccharimonadales bacterium]|nr:ATP-dependent helicase [Candidatus Saccharimonadales bacterium]
MGALDGLNEQQNRAATLDAPALLIVAGPGTGKTKTLTARIVHLLETGQARAEEIVALTFTNKAAREMQERVRGSLPAAATVPAISTFHALGQRLLERHGQTGTLITEQQRAEIIRSLPRPKTGRLEARKLSLELSNAKTSLRAAPEPLNSLLAAYQTALAAENLWDFDDLLLKPYELLRAGVLQPPAYCYVLVDEFQDTSELQYELLKLLAAQAATTVIGDPKQSIYSFRGAGAEMFTRFRQDFPAAETVELTVNYRSRPQIVRLANAVFPDEPQLIAHAQTAGTLHALQTLNEYSEAEYIIRAIEAGIGGSDFLRAGESGHDDAGRQPCDYAVLYRTHRAAAALQKAFDKSGLPYQIAGDGTPYARPEIQTLLALLACLQTPEVPAPVVKNLKATQVQGLLKTINFSETTPVCDAAAELAQKFDLGGRALQQFLGTLVQYGAGPKGLAKALTHIAEIAEQEFYDPTVNAVTLLTIHASKGLEFEHVFLLAAEEGILPKTDARAAANLDEERRLFYVAATRARAELAILHAQKRGGSLAELSRFVGEQKDEILPKTTDPSLPALQKRLKKREQKRAQTSLF